ncbi:MAG: T9SS type A sorting domain-containing protein [Bacteroidetes bacterium]|nr:T9SS type A sorting domain-containing protein [Bacteroidota bacterium]
MYPNPATNNLFFDITGNDTEIVTICYIDVIGNTIKETISISKDKNTYRTSEFSKLKTGIYFVQMVNENNEVIKSQKVIKQ